MHGKERTVHQLSPLVMGIAAAVFVVACASRSATPPPYTGEAGAAPAVAAVTTETPPEKTAIPFRYLIREVSEDVKPAVVQITNEQVQVNQFQQAFTLPAGVGSGILYDSQGHILTNNHVVAGAKRLLVSLPDGRSFPGELVGGDPQTDLAVVKISGRDLPVAKLGDPDTLHVGDWVVAIGNALALPGGPTVSAGVVSALDRVVQIPSSSPAADDSFPEALVPTAGVYRGPFLFDLIQTTTPINPGNSGGPLINLDGEVIGINTLSARQVEPGVRAEGIGFAISMATAKCVADQLTTTGKVAHPYLGIQYVPLSPGIAAILGIPQTQGVLVLEAVPDSPGELAGLQLNDIIQTVDGVALRDESALDRILIDHSPGDTVTLNVLREYLGGNEELTMRITLAEQP